MKLDHSACVPAGCDEVWRFVNDIPAVVECVPGAHVAESVDESTYRGLVSISVGPWSLAYQGTLVVVDRDDGDRTLRMEVSGTDRKGAGTARAAISLEVVPEDPSSGIRGRADVALTGPVASLSAAITRAVSSRLFEQFAVEMSEALTRRSSGHPRPTDRRPDSVQVAPLLWSVTRERVAGYLRGLGRRRP